MEIITTIIGLVSTIIGSTICIIVKDNLDKRDKKENESSIAKQKENVLIIKSIHSLGKLTMANSIALRDGRTNGEMKDAMDTYDEVNNELYDYLLEQNSKKK